MVSLEPKYICRVDCVLRYYSLALFSGGTFATWATLCCIVEERRKKKVVTQEINVMCARSLRCWTEKRVRVFFRSFAASSVCFFFQDEFECQRRTLNNRIISWWSTQLLWLAILTLVEYFWVVFSFGTANWWEESRQRWRNVNLRFFSVLLSAFHSDDGIMMLWNDEFFLLFEFHFQVCQHFTLSFERGEASEKR